MLSACASQPESPEEQLRARLAQAEAAAEQRDLDAIRELLSESYRDAYGHTNHTVIRRLNVYFLQNRSIHLLTRVDSLAFADSTHATASVLVAMAGHPIEDPGPVALARAAIYRFVFTFADEGHGTWRVTHASWQRATAGDFF